jgi:hypothetical protein
MIMSARAQDSAERLEKYVAEVIMPYENDPRRDHHGPPLDELVMEMRSKAPAAGVLSLHILADGSHLPQLETAFVLRKSGLLAEGSVPNGRSGNVRFSPHKICPKRLPLAQPRHQTRAVRLRQ